MLLQRILTAIPLALGIIWVILFQPSDIFFWVLLVFIAVAAYEWAKLSGLKTTGQIIYLLIVCTIPWFLLNHAHQYIQYYIYAAVLWWFVICIYLFKAHPESAGSKVSPAKLAIGVLVIPAALLSMISIHAQHNGPQWLLYGLMLVWVADIGAYFSGKRFGRNKLAPAISPGKTREGLYGAVAAVCVYTAIAAYYFGLDMTSTAYLLLLSVVLTLVSVAGDLYESVLKREHGVKDSGAILPGHGGILDRIDSVLAAMPVFVTGHALLLQPVLST
jgi:phosphatidate cytidylyltransferase